MLPKARAHPAVTAVAGWSKQVCFEAHLSTGAARDTFHETYVVQARDRLTNAHNYPERKQIYEELGELWATTVEELEEMPASDQHVPEEESTLLDDVETLVAQVNTLLWNELQPKYHSQPLNVLGTYTIAKAPGIIL